MKLKNLKLAGKQAIGFGLILFIMTLVNLFALSRMRLVKEEMRHVANDWMQRVIAISSINLATSNLRNSQLQWAIQDEKENKVRHSVEMIALIDSIDANLDTYIQLKNNAPGDSLFFRLEGESFSRFEESWESYQNTSLLFFGMISQNRRSEALELLSNNARISYSNLSLALQQLVKINREQADLATLRAEDTFQRTRAVTIAWLLLTIGLSVIFAGGLIRWISIPIRQLAQAAQAVARGNLDVQLKVRSEDEIGNLTGSFNRMTHSLRETSQKLEQKNRALEENSRILAEQNEKIEQNNEDLEAALEKLKNTQEQLLMKEKMASLGDLVAGVAHEINNPIGSMQSSADVARRCVARLEKLFASGEQSLAPETVKQLQQLLKMLDSNIAVTITGGERIGAIVKSLKNFARLDEAEYQKVDVHEGIESSLTLLGHEFSQRIEVQRNYMELPKLPCYPGELNQVWINLLRNAAQAISGLGVVRIETQLIAGANGRLDQIQIDIGDNGRGIVPERLKRIFDFDFSSGEGRIRMGSGLASSYNIIQRHHGEIKVESKVGEGSLVTLLLPLDASLYSHVNTS